jgi:hypothetical protein
MHKVGKSRWSHVARAGKRRQPIATAGTVRDAARLALLLLLSVSAVSCRHTNSSDGIPDMIDLAKAPGTVFRVTMQREVVRVERAAFAKQLLAVSRDGGSFLFDRPGPEVAQLKPGVVVLFSHLALRKVVSVQAMGDLVLVNTRPPGLQEAIRDGTMQWDCPISFAEVGHLLAMNTSARLNRTATTAGGLPSLVQPVYAAENNPVTIRHSGEKDGWQYQTVATVAKDRLDLEEVLRRQEGGMEIKLQAKGYLENFRSSASIRFENGAITRFEYVNKEVRGKFDFEWATRKADPGPGTIPQSSQIVKLPPFAEVPLDIQGFPFTLDITSEILVKPALSGAMESALGHFTIEYNGDQGFRVVNGVTTPLGSLHTNSQITENMKSMSPYAPMGFVAAIALPRLELKQGFVPTSLSKENGALVQRVQQLIYQNGPGAKFEVGFDPTGSNPGSFVEIITSTGLVDSGRLVMFPCQQTTLVLSLKVGGAGTMGIPVNNDGQHYPLEEHHRINPPIQACKERLVYSGTQQPSSGDLLQCDSNAVGSAAYAYGVPGGSILRGFEGEFRHQGIDVKKLRDAPVFVNLRSSVPIEQFNNVHVVRGRKYFDCNAPSWADGTDKPSSESDCFKTQKNSTGLHIEGRGDAQLITSEVIFQWKPPREMNMETGKLGDDYGDVVGLALHYRYQANDGSSKMFTVYLEYEHLISDQYLPRKDGGQYVDNENQPINAGEYTGCKNFGAKIKLGAELEAVALAQFPLVGYLGASETPHVHIQAAYAPGNSRYLRGPLFDPSILLGGH